MLALLEGLGLTAYEARALDDLLQHGTRTAPVLSREAEIPFGRVYDTLHGLVERGLVQVEPGRPKTFRVANAHALPDRLLAGNQRRLDDEAAVMQAKAVELGRAVEALRTKPEPGGAYGVRLGMDSARNVLIEATHQAREQVAALLALERIEEEDLKIFQAFREAVRRGVRTRILLRADDVDYLLTTPYVDDVLEAVLPHLGENLEVRLTWEAKGIVPFASLDRKRAMLGVKNPLDPEAYFAVIHVDDPVFSMGLEGRFDALWQEAEEPGGLIQWALGKKGGKALLRYGNKLRSRGNSS